MTSAPEQRHHFLSDASALTCLFTGKYEVNDNPIAERIIFLDRARVDALKAIVYEHFFLPPFA